MKDALCIGGAFVRPGDDLVIGLRVARLNTHTDMTMPVRVIRGKKTGPRLFVSAAIHGDEINGVEIIRRLLASKELKSLRGTLIVVPVVNVYGFIAHSRYLPDRRDLNRVFPGSERGSLGARLANLFMKEVVANATHGIDLHTGAIHRSNLPHVRTAVGHKEAHTLASVFGAPVVLNVDVRDGSLREAVTERGVPMLLYEGGEALRFDEEAIRIGLRGILEVMYALGMVSKRPGDRPKKPAFAMSSSWVRANASGILRSTIALGNRVKKNQELGVIAGPFGDHEVSVRAPSEGVVLSRMNLPVVNEGEALFHIAHVGKGSEATNSKRRPAGRDADGDLTS